MTSETFERRLLEKAASYAEMGSLQENTCFRALARRGCQLLLALLKLDSATGRRLHIRLVPSSFRVLVPTYWRENGASPDFEFTAAHAASFHERNEFVIVATQVWSKNKLCRNKIIELRNQKPDIAE